MKVDDREFFLFFRKTEGERSMGKVPQPVIALASCSKTAIAIATNTLALGMPRSHFDIVHRPFLANDIGFVDMRSVILSSFAVAKGLFEVTEHASLSICVAQELVSEKIGSRCGEMFAVGMIALHYKGGPLSAFYSMDWIPESKLDQWQSAIRETGEDLDAGEREPPDAVVRKAADAIGNALIQRLVLEEMFDFARVH